MPALRFVSSSLSAVLALALGCSGNPSTTVTPPCTGSSCTATVTGKVTVAGTQLRRDGVVWSPHGFVQIAFVAPPAAQAGVFLAANQNYSPSEFAAMKAVGADTVRMQVSQPGLDPQNALFTQSFLTTVQNAVLAARAAGLNVIVSVQDESQSGETGVASLFNADTGILYEMLNEPNLAANPANYQLWATAMNATISTIRATGSTNVVVAGGLSYALQLGGAPFLTDSANQVAYAEHPYFHSAADQTSAIWDSRFGNFAATAPVIVTEWVPVGDCATTGCG